MSSGFFPLFSALFTPEHITQPNPCAALLCPPCGMVLQVPLLLGAAARVVLPAGLLAAGLTWVTDLAWRVAVDRVMVRAGWGVEG